MDLNEFKNLSELVLFVNKNKILKKDIISIFQEKNPNKYILVYYY